MKFHTSCKINIARIMPPGLCRSLGTLAYVYKIKVHPIILITLKRETSILNQSYSELIIYKICIIDYKIIIFLILIVKVF